jgi:hypothetical protein
MPTTETGSIRWRPARALLLSGAFRIEYTDYDWALNIREP